MGDAIGIKTKSEKSEIRRLIGKEGGRMILKLMFIEQGTWCGLCSYGCEWNSEVDSRVNC
jgi:hypothetical protein